jgi:hypothetical protein
MFNFYYVISAFPPISIGQKSEMTYEEALQMVALNLSPADWKQVVLLQRLVDIRNIRALWLQEPLDPRGNLKEKELEEALLVGDEVPAFVIQFLNRYESLEDRLRYFPSLMVSLFNENIHQLKGFLRAYYQLDREIRLCLTALRAKASHRDLIRELQFEDPSDPFVAQLLAQKDETFWKINPSLKSSIVPFCSYAFRASKIWKRVDHLPLIKFLAISPGFLLWKPSSSSMKKRDARFYGRFADRA